MSILSEARAMLDPFANRLKDILLTAVLDRVNESTKLRELKFRVLVNDDDDEIPHVEGYGWSSRPFAGAEAILANIGADSDQVVALVVFDRRYRPTNLAEGEVIVFDDQGQYLKLARLALVLEAPSIQGGAGATKGVNRVGDTVTSAAAQDAVFWAWVASVNTLLTLTGPGLPVLTGALTLPTSLSSVTGAGSSVLKAVD